MSGVTAAGARVVVTGAGSGIGAAVARRYAGQGAHVVAVDIDDAAAERTAAECAGLGSGESRALTCDVADADAVDAVADACGDVDVLINNAGVGLTGRFLEYSREDIDWLLGVNLHGVINGCRSFAPGMVARRRGHIVNIASASGYMPSRKMAPYAASKAAVIQFSRCLRADLRDHGVGVSVVCPGMTNTPIKDAMRVRGDAHNGLTTLKRIWKYAPGPDPVARAVTTASAKDRALVTTGIDAAIGYQLMRLAPESAKRLLAQTW